MQRILRALPVLLIGVFLHGCSTLPGWLGGGGSSLAGRAGMERLVADDFATALAALPATAPAGGALMMSRPETPFGNALLVALRRAGYELVYDDDVASDRYVLYRLESRENQFGTSVGYSVSAGDVTLSRDYNMKASGVYPISFLRVRGADARQLTLDDQRFRRQSDDETIITGINPDPALALPAAASAVETESGMPLTEINGQTIVDKRDIERGNMYETRRSSFADFLQDYESVSREVLVFPDDSLRLLPAARDQLQALRGRFDERTDVVSVIGCSHGVTALDNGNELLAVGRSRKVLEELVSLGISDQQVLDEGCWAGEHFERMPARGVVVELKRLPG